MKAKFITLIMSLMLVFNSFALSGESKTIEKFETGHSVYYENVDLDCMIYATRNTVLMQEAYPEYDVSLEDWLYFYLSCMEAGGNIMDAVFL